MTVRQTLLLVIGLAIVLGFVLGGLVIAFFKHWQAEQQAPAVPTRVEDYRVLMEKGLLDSTEFERIRAHLGKGETTAQGGFEAPPAAPRADPPAK